MGFMGDLQLCVSEDRAQALETSSCPNFSQLFPSGLSHPKATLRNGTFIHLSPPPEAPRPWHSALGLKKTKGPRKPGRSIYGTDVQFHCGFAASQHSDRQVDVYRSASGKAISPERHAAVDTTSVTANGLTVDVPTGHKRKRLDLCQLENIPLASNLSPNSDLPTEHNIQAPQERGKSKCDLRNPQLEHAQVSRPLTLTQSDALSTVNMATEPGRVFRDETGRKRLVPILTSMKKQSPIRDPSPSLECHLDLQSSIRDFSLSVERHMDSESPNHDFGPSTERHFDLKSSILCQPLDLEDTRLGKKSWRRASQVYLGLESMPVDRLFYDKARFGDMLDTRIIEPDDLSFPRSASGSTGQQLYIHSRIKHYLRSRPMGLFSGTERRLGRLPYPSWIGKKKMPLSVTTFSRNADQSVVAFRSKRLSWRKGSGDIKGSTHRNAEKLGLFEFAEIAPEDLDLEDELKGLEKWKYLDEHQHVLPAYGESGSEGEYDIDTWREMEDEADRKLERPERKSNKLLLDVGKVQNTIAVAMQSMIAEWDIKKRPKMEAKAWRIWTKAKRDKNLHHQVREKEGKIEGLELRVKKLCARIIDEPWSTTKALTRQCKIMEVSIFDIEELKWARQMLLNPLAPKKARISVRPNKRAPKQDSSPRDTSPLREGEEIISSTSGSCGTSGDELEDFIVSDEDDSGSLRPAAVCDSDSDPASPSSAIDKARNHMSVANKQQPASLRQPPHPQSSRPASSPSKHLSHNIIDLTLDPESSEGDSKAATEATITRILTPVIDSDSSSDIWRRGKKTSFRTPPNKRTKEEVVDLVSSPDMDYKFLSALPAAQRKSSELRKSNEPPTGVVDERLQHTEDVVVKPKKRQTLDKIEVNPDTAKGYRFNLDPSFGNGRVLKAHQTKALQNIWKHVVATPDPGHGYILAHTMGLGKTATVIAVIHAIAQIGKGDKRWLKARLPDSLHNLHALILCPAHLVKNWVEELRRWLPFDDDRVQTLYKVTSSDPIGDRIEIVRNWALLDGVLVMSFTIFKDLVDSKSASSEPAAFRANPRARAEVENALLGKTALVIVDEAHSIKNPQSEISKSVNRIRTRRRIGLTGSPLSNNLAEYYALINWAAPGHLGAYDQFRSRYETVIEKIFLENTTAVEYRSAIVALKALQKDIEPRVNRADSRTLDPELFGKEEFLIRIPLSGLQFDLYKNYVKHLEGSSAQDAFRRWKHIRLLQLLCLHPSLLIADLRACSTSWSIDRQDPNFEEQLPDNGIEVDAPIPPESYVLPQNDPTIDYQRDIMSAIHTSTEHLLDTYDGDWTNVDESYKMQVLMAIVKKCSRIEDKVLIFSQRKPVISYVAARLRKNKYNVVVIEGQVHPEKRQEISEAFNTSNKFQVCVISTLAGGIGLNLHGANRVIILDEGYNPTHEEQAIGRAYRIGQRRKVYVYRLVCAGTIEDAFRDQGILKGNLAARVLDRKVAREKNIRGNGRSPKVVAPQRVQYDRLSQIEEKDRLLDQMLLLHGRDFIMSITSLHSYRPEDTEELTATERADVDAMQLQEAQRRETDKLARAATSKANGSRGQSTAPSNPSLGLITASSSATTGAPTAPAVASPTPAPSAPAVDSLTPAPSAPSSWPSFPATAHNSRATSLPSTSAASNHASAHSNASLPAPEPRANSQPVDSINEPLQPLQPLQTDLQSTKLVRFRIDAPNSQGSGPNKRQKLE